MFRLMTATDCQKVPVSHALRRRTRGGGAPPPPNVSVIHSVELESPNNEGGELIGFLLALRFPKMKVDHELVCQINRHPSWVSRFVSLK